MVHKFDLAWRCKPLWTPYGERVCPICMDAWPGLGRTAPHWITSHKTLTHIRKRAHTHTHVPARRVQVCDGLGVLGVGHPLSRSPSAPSSELAFARGQAATSICLVNTEISKAPPSPQQKIAQTRPASAKIACYAESTERIYLLSRRMWT